MPEAPKKGRVVNEGKTKIVYEVENNPTMVVVSSKDDITAGDGKKHDLLPGKGEWSTRTTSNVFRLLKECNLPVAFEDTIAANEFLASKCDMLPFEVVVRREAHGSFLQRNPHLRKGFYFPKLIVEFYLKTAGRKWGDKDLVCDDPLIAISPSEETFMLYNPHEPIAGQKPFLNISSDEACGSDRSVLKKMEEIARLAFLVLEKAWQLQGCQLVDFKVEFGIVPSAGLFLADVIDNDSWRVLSGGRYIDKQRYRDGAGLSEVAAEYATVAELTSRFVLPSQSVIIWRGSVKDDVTPFIDALKNKRGTEVVITRSCHKEPIDACLDLNRAVQDCLDSVVIVYTGRSNAAGPMLAANCTVPVITVPANIKEFPQDVWSSLRAASQVPVMTVSDPGNAVLAALQILAMRNPELYAQLRYEQEKRFTNVVPL